jgi:glycosyltransferase involved in cell wall biosynthesis
MTLLLGARVTAWLISAAWVGKLVEAAWGIRRVPNLLEAQYNVWPAGQRVAVVVPARNEAANVGACLRSLIAQDYDELQIIAVDDRSNDGTGNVMQDLASAHADRLNVISVAELPSGWLGKTHAMAIAADKAMSLGPPEWLLFTDGDILFAPDAVRRAVAQAVATEADHFVVLPTTEVKTHGEGMMLGYLQVMSLWAVRPWRVSNPRAKRDAIGVGAFNLMRTQAYERLGGFGAIRLEILEDLELGRRVKRAGMRQCAAFAPGMVRVHWAAGAMGIMRNMTKNLFALFRYRAWMLLLAALGTGVLCLVPEAMLCFRATRLAGACGTAAVVGLYMLSARTTRISWTYAIGFPFATATAVYAMLRSMTVTIAQGGVLWRGTFYPLNELRKRV